MKVLTRLRFKKKRAASANSLAQLISLRAGDSRRLVEADYVRAGATLGVSPAVLNAFATVESNGSGFNPDGRLTILYEAHIATRHTKQRASAMKRHPDLYSGNWKSDTNKAIYRMGQADRWDILARSAALDFEAALKATSWGAFQILGQNAESLGFDSTFEMVEHMYSGHAAHLDCALRFLRVNDLIAPLQRGDWRIIAARYNGTGNVERYSTKLANAHQRFESVYA